VLSRRIPICGLASCVFLIGLLCSLPSAAQEITPAASGSPDIAWKVTLAPSPFAQLVKDAQDETNPQQTTSQTQRAAHALSRVVITRSDCGQTQFNYSEILGAGTAAAVSTYTYHPESERSFEYVTTVWASQMGWDAATYMVKEFRPDLRKKRHKDTQQ
jgi:hypothetical protein